MRLFSLLTLFTLYMANVVSTGSPCVAFDISWNLLAFGFNDKDYDAGTQDTWASGSATDITTTGRPPFDTNSTTCYLSQFENAIYVMGADSQQPSAIYIYDASARSWSTQPVTTNGFNPTSFSAILDHDTNVFYALSNGEMYSLDMGNLKAANSSSLSWLDVQNPGFGNNYQPVMALAQNHIFFLDVPGVSAGSAKIFVIHFSFLQPDPQPLGNFPATHGQATSFFEDSGVQQEFAFIPDDGSVTYIINVESNTTQSLQGPTIKDPMATYFASTDSLVQLASSGAVSFLPFKQGSTADSASWAPVANLPKLVAASGGASSNSSSSSGGASSSSSSSNSSATNSANGAASTNGTGGPKDNGALTASVQWSTACLLAFVMVALFL